MKKEMNGWVEYKTEKYYTLLRGVFEAIQNRQKSFQWLILNHECYPRTPQYTELLAKPYCWMSGCELTEMIKQDNFQWIWGALLGFPSSVSKEEILTKEFLEGIEMKSIWKNPVHMHHPLAECEIIAWDSTVTVLISKDEHILECFKKAYPQAEDLEKYND